MKASPPILDLNDEGGRDSDPVSPSQPQGGVKEKSEKRSPTFTPPNLDKKTFQAPLGPIRKGQTGNVVPSRFVAMYTTPVKSSQRSQQHQQSSSLSTEESFAQEEGDMPENSAPIDIPVTGCEEYDVMYSHHARSFCALEFSNRYLKRIDNPDKEILAAKERCNDELRIIRDKMSKTTAVDIVDELLECSLGDVISGKFRDASRKITQFYLDESSKETLNIGIFSKLLLSIARVNRLVEFVQAETSPHNTLQKEDERQKHVVETSSPLKTMSPIIIRDTLHPQEILSTPPQNNRDAQKSYHTPIVSSSPLRTTPLVTKDDQHLHKANKIEKSSIGGSLTVLPPPQLQEQDKQQQHSKTEANNIGVIPFSTPKQNENDLDADDREVSVNMISSSFVTIDSPQVKITPIKSDEKRRSPSIGRATSRKVCCRICEQYIPFEDIDKHTKECSKNNSVYAQLNDIKMKIAKFCGLSSSRRAAHGAGARRIHDILREFVDKCDLDTIDPAFVASAKETYCTIVTLVDEKRENDDTNEKLSATEIEDATAILESLSKFIKLCGNIQGITKSGRSKLSAVTIHDFEFIKSIGKGAFGNVYLSRKKTTGDVYAIKRLNKQQAVLKNQLTHIKAERNILASTNSPFLIRSYFSFQTKDNLYLVMEYAPGGDVYSLLKNLGCLDEDMTRTYVAQIVLALGYLHKMNIIHRDLKPDNLLISATGHIKLTDFGLSSYGLINDNESRTSLDPVSAKSLIEPANVTTDDEIFPTTPENTLKTPLKIMGTDASNTNSVVFNNGVACSRHKRYSVVGTPDYLAPEVILGTGHDKNVDWCYEFLTGIPPFNDDTPEKIFENILTRNIEWPKIPDDISFEAYDFISKLLSIDITQRLGYNNDAEELKQHPFLKDVDWDSLLSEDAAVFVPQLDSQTDTSYFDEDRQGSMGGVLRDITLSGKSTDDTTALSFDGNGTNQSSPTVSKVISASMQSPQASSFIVPSLTFSPASSISSPTSNTSSEGKRISEQMESSASPSKEYDVFSDFSYTNVSNLQSLTLEKTMRKK